MAALPQVFCKLSGLWTEAGPGAPVAAVQRYADHLLACFGPRRLLWGSDWPVLERAGAYAEWHAAARALVPPADQAEVFAGTARRAYRLRDPHGG
jgi:L-fuconolactonase